MLKRKPNALVWGHENVLRSKGYKILILKNKSKNILQFSAYISDQIASLQQSFSFASLHKTKSSFL